MTDEIDEMRLTVRMTAELHRALMALAKVEHRSVNAQIVYLLERAVRPSAAESAPPER